MKSGALEGNHLLLTVANGEEEKQLSALKWKSDKNKVLCQEKGKWFIEAHMAVQMQVSRGAYTDYCINKKYFSDILTLSNYFFGPMNASSSTEGELVH